MPASEVLRISRTACRALKQADDTLMKSAIPSRLPRRK
jgi:hypothetical protein